MLGFIWAFARSGMQGNIEARVIEKVKKAWEEFSGRKS
jgi:hypothetical protein